MDRLIRDPVQLDGLGVRDPGPPLGNLLENVQPTLAMMTGRSGNRQVPIACGPTGVLSASMPNVRDMELVDDVTEALVGGSTAFASTVAFDAIWVIARTDEAGVLIYLDDAASVEETIVPMLPHTFEITSGDLYSAALLFGPGRRLGWRVLGFGGGATGFVNVIKYRRRS